MSDSRKVALALTNALRPVHKLYADEINKRMGWTGHLWQERFYSSVVDEDYFWVVMRYIARNPVEVGMVSHPWEYRWSGAAAHCGIREDKNLLISRKWQAKLSHKTDWLNWYNDSEDQKKILTLEKNTLRYLPSGSYEFLESIEKATGIPTRPRRPGPKKKKI